jgi:hypothetical protein
MIVRDAGSCLVVVTQPDHAAAAAHVMAHWRAQGFPARSTRGVTLYATAHHDLGWAVEDAAPRVNPATRRPFDFAETDWPTRQAVWPRAVADMSRSSVYAAALIAQHAIAIHRRFRTEPAWAAFFATMEQLRDRWFAAPPAAAGTATDDPAGAPPPAPADPRSDDRLTFLQDYVIVRMGDLASLLLCTGWTHTETLDGYQLRRRGDVVEVAPDPFEGVTVPLEVAARRIPARPYASDDDLRTTLGAARRVSLTGRIVGVEALR